MSQLCLLYASRGQALSKKLCDFLRRDGRESRRSVVFVPDQYTMTAESFLLDELGENAMLGVTVRTFKRFSSAVLREHGVTGRVLGKAGKRALVLRACREASDRLTVYRDCASAHFAEALDRQISELKTYRVTPDDLRKTGSEKLCDIATLCETYDALLNDTPADPDDRLHLCASCVDARETAQTSYYADFFKVLNASETEVLLALLAAGADVTVTLKTPDPHSKEDVLRPVNTVWARLVREAKRLGAEVTEVRCEEQEGVMPSDLLFRTGAPCAYDENKVRFYRAAGRTDEVEYACAEMARLVRDEGYRYRDFAVVARNMDTYEATLDAVASEYDIPLFMHRKSALRRKLPVRLCGDVLDAVTEADAASALVDLARSGAAAISAEEASCFEKYVFTWRLRYLSSFKKEFKRSPAGFDARERETDEDRAVLDTAESVRRRLFALVEPFCVKETTVRDWCEKIYYMTESAGLFALVEALGKRYRESGEAALDRENRQVYRLLMDTLDELVCADDKGVVNAQTFRSLLFAAADATDIGIIPTSADAVLTGPADTVPLLGQKVVFCLGLAEGEFPRTAPSTALISDRDRRALEKADVFAGIGDEDRYLYELYVARFVLSAARVRTVLTYPAVTRDKTVPSVVLTQTMARFKDAAFVPSPDPDVGASYADRVQSRRPSFMLAATQDFDDLKQYFREQLDAEKRSAEMVDTVSPSTADRLFGTRMSLSYSRVDTFYRCRYHYFVRYGLHIQSRRAASFDPCNSGTFLHAMFETVMHDPDWLSFGDEQLYARVRQAADKYFDAVFGDDKPGASFYVYLNNLVDKTCRLLRRFAEQLKNSAFHPAFFELPVREDADVKPVVLKTSRGEVCMTGQIDRVDVCERDGVCYLRIADYKSGKKKFNLKNIYNGIDIQLLMYLYALQVNGRELLCGIRPSAAMYVSARGDITNEISTEKNDTIGFFVDDGVASAGDILHMDALGRDELNGLFRHVCDLLVAMADTLGKGELTRAPYDTNTCNNCDIRAVCPHAGKARASENFDKTVLASLAGEVSDRGGTAD